MRSATTLAVPPALMLRMQALERQKERNALAAPPPDHWLAVPNTGTVYYLPLPFEGGAPPAEPALNASTVHEMTRQVPLLNWQMQIRNFSSTSAVLGAIQGVPRQLAS